MCVPPPDPITVSIDVWVNPNINLKPQCPPTRVKITNDPNDEEAWATETRWGAANMPAGIAFLSRERCEAFRAQHPVYTRPHEVCERVYFKRLWVQP